MRFSGKTVIVTGAARGIGEAIARRFASEGADLALWDIDPSVSEMATQIQAEFHVRAIAARMDVVDSTAVEQSLEAAGEHFGRIDVLANNAGVVQPMIRVTETPDDLVDRVLDVNFRGTFNCARAAARRMSVQQMGRIINVASWFGKTGHAQFAVYCASKAAVINFTQTLAQELAEHGVTVNCVAPGNVDTEMHWRAIRDEAELRGVSYEEMSRLDRESIPLGRVASPDEIAAAFAFLASDDAAYITGQTINVNGGIEFH